MQTYSQAGRKHMLTVKCLEVSAQARGQWSSLLTWKSAWWRSDMKALRPLARLACRWGESPPMRIHTGCAFISCRPGKRGSSGSWLCCSCASPSPFRDHDIPRSPPETTSIGRQESHHELQLLDCRYGRWRMSGKQREGQTSRASIPSSTCLTMPTSNLSPNFG